MMVIFAPLVKFVILKILFALVKVNNSAVNFPVLVNSSKLFPDKEIFLGKTFISFKSATPEPMK